VGVTREPVKSGSSVRPADVYTDLLKKNLANRVKGTSPGHVRHGSEREEPPPDVFIYGCNFDFSNMRVKPVDISTLDRLLVNRKFCRTICTVEFDFSIIFIGGKVTLFGQVVEISDMDFPVGPRLRFHPEPIKLPTAAIFFQTPDYGGAALVALEAGTGWFGGSEVHIDVNMSGTFNQARVKFIEQLSRINDVLNVVKFFSLNGIPGLDQITNVIGKNGLVFNLSASVSPSTSSRTRKLVSPDSSSP